jgi:hypothetical protein
MTIRANALVRDAGLVQSIALPAAAGTVNGLPIDLGDAMTARGARLADCELVLTAPALNTTDLPNTVTAIYAIQGSTTNFGTVVPLATACLTQTGAAGAGAALQTWRMKLPSDCPRYIRASVVTATNAGNCALKSMELALQF